MANLPYLDAKFVSCMPCTCDGLMNEIVAKLAAATGRSRLHSLPLSDLNSGLVVDGGGSHAFLDLAGHGQKGLFDIGGVLCGGLEEWDTEAISELLLPDEHCPS